MIGPRIPQSVLDRMTPRGEAIYNGDVNEASPPGWRAIAFMSHLLNDPRPLDLKAEIANVCALCCHPMFVRPDGKH